VILSIVAAVSAASILKNVLMILAAIFALGVVVIIHELGHFISAKKAGVKVETFSIGFGPKLWGIKKGETEYRVSLLFIAGGYVKMKGMEAEGDKPPQEIEGGFYAANPGRRAFIAFAAPAMNVVLALAVFTVLWFTGTKVRQGVLTTTIGYLEEGGPGRRAGLVPGDAILKVNGEAVNEWQDVMQAVAFNPANFVDLVINRNGKTIEKHISVKRDKEVGFRHLRMYPRMDLLIEEIEKESPADELGLRKGDTLLSVAGERLFHIDQFREVLRNNIGKEVELVVSRHDESSHELTFSFSVDSPGVGVKSVRKKSPARKIGLREGDLIVTAAGQKIPTVGVFEQVLNENVGKEIKLEVEQGRHPFTAAPGEEKSEKSVLGANLETGYPVLGFLPGVVYGVKKQDPFTATYSAIRMVVRTLKGLITRTVSTKGISGPVGIIGLIRWSISVSFTTFLYFIGFLSANFAVINLLPIPIVDGGHIMFCAIEKVRRKPIRQKTMNILVNTFFVLILAFFLFVTKNDITRFFKGRPKEGKVFLTLKVPEEGVSLSPQEGGSTLPEQ